MTYRVRFFVIHILRLCLCPRIILSLNQICGDRFSILLPEGCPIVLHVNVLRTLSSFYSLHSMGLFSSHLICSEAHRSRMCLILDQIYVYERVVVMTTLGQIKVRRVGLLHKVLLVVAEFLWDYLGYLLRIIGKSVRHQVWSVVIMVLVVVIVRFYCGQIFGFKRFLCRVVVDKL